MLPKFRGASRSTLVVVMFPSLVEEMRRSKEKRENENASTSIGIVLMYFHYSN
jgi:zinc transporter ZupT